MDSPIISVITTAYNVSGYIGECIVNILNQTLRNIELIIINDCSTDRTLDIINQYKKKDSRIKVINNNTNMGPAISRNYGLKIAKGKYIAIQDADDISLPQRFETQFKYLEENPNIFLVSTDNIVRYEGEMEFINKCPSGSEYLKHSLPMHNSIIHSSVMFRNGFAFSYREKFKYAHDYDLYLQILSHGYEIDNIDHPLVVYRIAKDGISSTKAYYQALFGEKTQQFYRERIANGEDGYNCFDPDTIFSSTKSSINLHSKKNYSSENFFLDLLIYQDKVKALKFMMLHMSLKNFTLPYLIKKTILFTIPKSLAKKIRAKNFIQ